MLSAIQDKLVLKLQQTEKVYEIRFISQSLSTVVRLYDETVAKLDVDAIVDTAYESNKTETDKLFLDTEEDDYDLEEHKDQSEV